MKKSVLLVVLAVALVFAFAATASATSGKFWNYQEDYYSWGSTAGAGMPGVGLTLGQIGANPTNPGVHANYLANTAKCGICHSVHRAKAGGVKLLNTSVATCAGCHKAGTSTVTDVVVSWQTGGPHSSGTDTSCNSRGCHLNSPHGAGGSKYKIFAAKLINNVAIDASGAKADLSVAAAVADPAGSGITVADLNAEASSTWTAETRRTVVVGYTCNSWGCHEQSMLPVLKAGYAEERLNLYPPVEDGGIGTEILKTGHLTAFGSTEATASNGALIAFAPVESCTSCHDQEDAATRTGFTFPHSQTPYGASNMGTGRAYLWMGYGANFGAAETAMGSGDKAFDGACLKCHRESATTGLGLTY